ncbi:hypothetical protein CV83906_2p029 (plasmid) [Escherichia coli]|nr:hypothetical protein CV83906_2p029 [Escherichia coli]
MCRLAERKNRLGGRFFKGLWSWRSLNRGNWLGGAQPPK